MVIYINFTTKMESENKKNYIWNYNSKPETIITIAVIAEEGMEKIPWTFQKTIFLI